MTDSDRYELTEAGVLAVTSPDVPETDELARNAARNAFRDALDGQGLNDDLSGGAVERLADVPVSDMAVTYERDINSAGKAVRRVVMRGVWEIDPERANTRAYL